MRTQIFLTLLGMLVVLTPIKAKRGRLRLKRADDAIIQSCSNMVYCQGNLLHTIQKFRIHNDSKTFVDMTQINSESVTLQNFEDMMKTTSNPTKNDIVTFVRNNFISETESDEWKPDDYTETPAFLDRIRTPTIRNFAKMLVGCWPQLGRIVKQTVKQDPTRHSLIPLPNGFIVPGGRFREIYYWDSYWIIEGLLICEMKQTVKGMLENFIFLIKTYGLIPNGSRIYYINRSQPPLFTAMVGLYIDETNDIEWLKNNIDFIEQELLWWINKRTVSFAVNGVTHQLAHFSVESNTPRPESYGEDLETCSHHTDESDQRKCYSGLKTGAESGWDFSIRWFFDATGGFNANLSNIDTARVLPVDLNAMLCQAFRLLSEFYSKVGDETKKAKWADYADKWLKSIKTLLYNEQDGIWYDFDHILLRQRPAFFTSNFAPLWTDCYDLNTKETYGKKAEQYLMKLGIPDYTGGVPTSLNQTGEQWDFPNAWPPLQEFVVLGLYKTGDPDAKQLAEKFATNWIAANLKGYVESGAMYEKYDAVQSGKYGGGGEYDVQLGFGWSNGVALSFIKHFNSARMSKPILNLFSFTIVLSIFSYVHSL